MGEETLARVNSMIGNPVVAKTKLFISTLPVKRLDGPTEKFSGQMLAFGSIYEQRQLLVDHGVVDFREV